MLFPKAGMPLARIPFLDHIGLVYIHGCACHALRLVRSLLASRFSLSPAANHVYNRATGHLQ
jgi:hypothetical protein